RNIVSASSFSPVECHPTLSPGFSFTEPPRIPLVCGAPFSSTQSPPAQSSANVIGLLFPACPRASAPIPTSTATLATPTIHVLLIRIPPSATPTLSQLASTARFHRVKPFKNVTLA